jgi:uncharacterized protein (TIGR02646 family)
MRRLTKLPLPAVLAANAETWLTDYLADRGSATKRFRYRHAEIKETLRQETGWKCAYCESKVGHNTPGDIEHKVPSSKNEALHFEWTNLTVACTECNRRKNDYYETGEEFLDPYVDDVEACLIHLGPLVYWKPGHARAEITVRKLELDSTARPALVDRKRDVLEKARALLEGVAAAGAGLLRELRRDEVERMCQRNAEFSAMVRTYVEQIPLPG